MIFSQLRAKLLHAEHLWGREDTIEHIAELISAPLFRQSAASLLLIGTAASGKTKCLEHAVQLVMAKYGKCKIVRLSGTVREKKKKKNKKKIKE